MLVLTLNCTSGELIGTQLVSLNHVRISPLLNFRHLTLSLILGNSTWMSVHISQDLGGWGREKGDAIERVQGSENLLIMTAMIQRGPPKDPVLKAWTLVHYHWKTEEPLKCRCWDGVYPPIDHWEICVLLIFILRQGLALCAQGNPPTSAYQVLGL